MKEFQISAQYLQPFQSYVLPKFGCHAPLLPTFNLQALLSASNFQMNEDKKLKIGILGHSGPYFPNLKS